MLKRRDLQHVTDSQGPHVLNLTGSSTVHNLQSTTATQYGPALALKHTLLNTAVPNSSTLLSTWKEEPHRKDVILPRHNKGS